MKKTKWLDRRVSYPGPYLTLVLSKKELKRAVKGIWKGAYDMPSSGAKTWMFNNPKGEVCCVVGLSKSAMSRKPVEIAGLLVHEAVHVWQAYVDRIGEQNPGDEQEAYAIQGISQELMYEYSRRIK